MIDSCGRKAVGGRSVGPGGSGLGGAAGGGAELALGVDAQPDGDDGAGGDGEGERRVRDGAEDDAHEQQCGDEEQHESDPPRLGERL